VRVWGTMASDRINLGLLSAIIWALIPGTVSYAANKGRPNVLFIAIDDRRR